MVNKAELEQQEVVVQRVFVAVKEDKALLVIQV